MSIDRRTLFDHLALAERHVTQGDLHLTAQRLRIAELERDGHPTALARELLDKLAGLQRLHVADRDRLRRDLAIGEDDAAPKPAAKARRSAKRI